MINKDGELEDCISCVYASLRDGNKLYCVIKEEQVNDNDWCEAYE